MAHARSRMRARGLVDSAEVLMREASEIAADRDKPYRDALAHAIASINAAQDEMDKADDSVSTKPDHG